MIFSSRIIASLAITTTTALLASSSTTATAARYSKPNPKNHKIYNNLKDMPTTGEQWQTAADGKTEFQSAANLSPLAQEHLRRLTYGSSSGSENPLRSIYADSAETYYDEYAQAWRAIGFFVDCDYCGYDQYGTIMSDTECFIQSLNSDGNYNQNNYNSYIQNNYNNNDEDNNNNGYYQNNNNDSKGCQRFLLWAAYIDEGYSGGGVKEYAYYDRHDNSWDYEACDTSVQDRAEYQNNGNASSASNKRCVKMDCHESDTHFTLLGYFKEPYYDQWMEQLFKNQGDCVWSDEEYNNMQYKREAWPSGCTKTNTLIKTEFNGEETHLYYDVKPMKYGDMGIGLYIDDKCSAEYSGSEYTVGQVLQYAVCTGYIDGGQDVEYMCPGMELNGTSSYTSYNGNYNGKSNSWDLDEELALWNDAFDVYKQCQPCKASDLTDYVAKYNYNYTGTRNHGHVYGDQQSYNYNNNYYNNGDDEEEEDADGEGNAYGVFNCHDGYNNVNQCMKFATNTLMEVATWRDVEMAVSQGSTTTIIHPKTVSSEKNPHTKGSRVNSFGKSVRSKKTDTYWMVLAWVGLIGNAMLMGITFYGYFDIKSDLDRHKSSLKEPLMYPNHKVPSTVLAENPNAVVT